MFSLSLLVQLAWLDEVDFHLHFLLPKERSDGIVSKNETTMVNTHNRFEVEKESIMILNIYPL